VRTPPPCCPSRPPADADGEGKRTDHSARRVTQRSAAAETEELVERRGPDTIYSDSLGWSFYRGIGVLTGAVDSIATLRRGLLGVWQEMIKAVRQVALDFLDKRPAVARVDDAEMVQSGK